MFENKQGNSSDSDEFSDASSLISYKSMFDIEVSSHHKPQKSQSVMQSSIVTIQVTGRGNLPPRARSPTLLQRARANSSPGNFRFESHQSLVNADREMQPITTGFAHATTADLQELFPPPLVYIPTSADTSPNLSHRRMHSPTRGPRIPPSDVAKANFRIAPYPTEAAVGGGKLMSMGTGVRSLDPQPKPPTPTPSSPRVLSPTSPEPPTTIDGTEMTTGAGRVDYETSPQFYYRYYPFDEMTEIDRRHLKAEPRSHPTLTSTKEGESVKIPPRWHSATSANRCPSAYHMGDVSLHYRPNQRGRTPVKIVQLKDDTKLPKPRSAPARRPLANESGTRSTTASSSSSKKRPCTSNPKDVLNISTSNRLLHVMSIDECHVLQRSPPKRVQSAKLQQTNYSGRCSVGTKAGGSYNRLRSASGESIASINERLPDTLAPSGGSLSAPLLTSFENPSMGSLGMYPKTTSPIRPQSSTPMTKAQLAQQKERDEAIRAAEHFIRRNQVLREQMAVYIEWKTAERTKERYNMARGISSASPSVLRSRKEQRLGLFSAVLRQKEKEYAEAIAQMENEQSEDEEEKEDGYDKENDSEDDCLTGFEEEVKSEKGNGDSKDADGEEDATISPTPRDQSNKLTEMWSILE